MRYQMKPLLFLLILSIFSLNAAPLELVKNGRSDYRIVIEKNALPAVKVAAKEFQKYLKKSTGAEIPITNAAKGLPAVYIGTLKVNTPEGFIIKNRGHDLYISGYDTQGNPYSNHWRTAPQTGTWYGVSDFLEKQLGIRWFFPGQDGEYVPSHSNLTISELDIQDAPKMEYRYANAIIDYKTMSKSQIKECNIWLRRNRSGYSQIWCGWHTWLHDFRGEDYFKKHPEWFALVNGRRLGHAPLGLQMCTTNSQALDKFAETIIAKSKKNGGAMYSLTPNDGDNHCECTACQALDNGARSDGSRIMTNRYITYANEIAERVNRRLPNQTFGLIAYSFYAEPPANLTVNPNVRIMNVHNDSGITYYNPQIREEHLKQELQPWRKAVGKLYFYGTPEGMGCLELPVYQQRSIKLLFENLKKADIKGFSMNLYAGFGSTGLNYYLYLKKCWNPDLDTDKLYYEALRDCYGAAAQKIVTEYFNAVEKRMEHFANHGVVYDRMIGSVRRFPDMLEQVYPGLAEQYLPRLQDVFKQTTDHGQRARLKMLLDTLEYCRITVKLYQQAKKITATSSPSNRDIAEALELVKQRDRQITGMANLPNSTHPARIGKTTSAYHLPLSAEVFRYLFNTERLTATVKRVQASPKIDGKLEQEFWGQLPTLEVNHGKNDGAVSSIRTTARLVMDSKYLYIGVDCPEPAMNKNNDSLRKNGMPVWNENCIDIFLAPGSPEKPFYQLVLNSLGTFTTLIHHSGKSTSYDLGAEVKTVRGPAFWSAEIRLPLHRLSQKQDLLGSIWGFNICRVRRTVTPAEYTCWNPTFGMFNVPERFGKIILR